MEKLEAKARLVTVPGQEVRTRPHKGDGSTLSVATSVELFQDPHDVTTFILGMWNVYLGGLPVVAHGGGSRGMKSCVTIKLEQHIDHCGSETDDPPQAIAHADSPPLSGLLGVFTVAATAAFAAAAVAD